MLRLDANSFTGPDLFTTAQQMDHRNRDHILGAIPAYQPAFDESDLRADRAAKGNATGVVDIESNLSAKWQWVSDHGLQRIAAHGQSPYQRDTKQPLQGVV